MAEQAHVQPVGKSEPAFLAECNNLGALTVQRL
jgi:hypothetical protein